MKIIGFLRSITALVLDIDNTIYQRNKDYLAEGTHGEITGVAKILEKSFEEVMACIKETRRALTDNQLSNEATMTKTVYRLGISPKEWSELRLKAWRPEGWINADEEISTFIANLSHTYLIAFGTNSPVEVGRRIVRLVGIGKEAVPDVRIFGPENFGVSKPDPKFFSGIARAIQTPVGKCVSIGDREFSDGPPAIEAGFAGAIIISGGRDELLDIGVKLMQQ